MPSSSLNASVILQKYFHSVSIDTIVDHILHSKTFTTTSSSSSSSPPCHLLSSTAIVSVNAELLLNHPVLMSEKKEVELKTNLMSKQSRTPREDLLLAILHLKPQPHTHGKNLKDYQLIGTALLSARKELTYADILLARYFYESHSKTRSALRWHVLKQKDPIGWSLYTELLGNPSLSLQIPARAFPEDEKAHIIKMIPGYESTRFGELFWHPDEIKCHENMVKVGRYFGDTLNARNQYRNLPISDIEQSAEAGNYTAIQELMNICVEQAKDKKLSQEVRTEHAVNAVIFSRALVSVKGWHGLSGYSSLRGWFENPFISMFYNEVESSIWRSRVLENKFLLKDPIFIYHTMQLFGRHMRDHYRSFPRTIDQAWLIIEEAFLELIKTRENQKIILQTMSKDLFINYVDFNVTDSIAQLRTNPSEKEKFLAKYHEFIHKTTELKDEINIVLSAKAARAAGLFPSRYIRNTLPAYIGHPEAPRGPDQLEYAPVRPAGATDLIL